MRGLKGAILSGFDAGAHPDAFNNVGRYWGQGTGTVYPYVGKSTVNRGVGVGESNAPLQSGVRDLQLVPPSNPLRGGSRRRFSVAEFISPLITSCKNRFNGGRSGLRAQTENITYDTACLRGSWPALRGDIMATRCQLCNGHTTTLRRGLCRVCFDGNVRPSELFDEMMARTPLLRPAKRSQSASAGAPRPGVPARTSGNGTGTHSPGRTPTRSGTR
jgi:hypothetical protein